MGDLGVSVMGKGWYDGRKWGSWKEGGTVCGYEAHSWNERVAGDDKELEREALQRLESQRTQESGCLGPITMVAGQSTDPEDFRE